MKEREEIKEKEEIKEIEEIKERKEIKEKKDIKEIKQKQIYNPYLPSYEYVPDGEPHVFGERVYLYGSHDRFDGAEFCLNDYVCYSADVHDLTDWKYEGVIYRKEQDPRNQNIPADTPAPKPGFCAKQEGCVAGYKYFRIQNLNRIGLTVRGEAQGEFMVKTSPEGEILGAIPVHSQRNNWNTYAGEVNIPEGIYPLYFCYQGSGSLDLIQFHLGKI